MCGKSQTTTQQANQTTQPSNPQVTQDYLQLLQQAQQVGSQPYVPYTGQLVAPVNAQQQAGIAGVNAAANQAQPYYQTAQGDITSAVNQAQPIGTSQINQYLNPYTNQVVNATEAQFANMNAMQQQQVLGNAAAQGALGGNRVGVAQGVVAGQEALSEDPVIANLLASGYNQAVQTAMGEQALGVNTGLAAGYGEMAAGTGAQTAAEQGAAAQVQAGTLEQQTQQAQNNAAYQQYLAAQGFPYQQTQWLAGLETGVGGALGQTTSGTAQTTGPAPSFLGQLAGAGLAGVGFLGGTGAFGSSGYLNPSSSNFISRGGRVNYDIGGGVEPASLGVANYPLFGGGYGTPNVPYSGGHGFVPQMGIQGRGLQAQPLHYLSPAQDQGSSAQQMMKDAAMAAKAIGNLSGHNTPTSNYFSPAGLGTSDAAIYKRGGYVPTVAGFGTGGIILPRGYADGGSPSPNDYVYSNWPSAEQRMENYDITNTPEDPHRALATLMPQGQPPSNVDQRDIGAAQRYQLSAMAYGDQQQPSQQGNPLADVSTRQPQPTGVASPQAAPEQGGGGWGAGSPIWSGLTAAGLGMLSSRSPFPGVAIGEGGLTGLQAYNAERQRQAQLPEIAARTKELQLQAERAQQELSGTTPVSPYQREMLTQAQERITQEQWKPFTDVSGNTRFFNSKTGEVRDTPPMGIPSGGAPVTPSKPEAPQSTPTSEEKTKPQQYASLETNGVTSDAWGNDVKPAGTITNPSAIHRNDAALSGLDQRTQDLVKAVADYRKDIRTLGFRDRTMVSKFVVAYDPDWSESMYNTVNQAMKNFKGTGVEARNMTSQDMAVQHIGNALNNVRQLDLGNIPWWNTLKTGVMSQYDPKTQAALGALQTDVHAVGDELMRSFRGTGQPSEKEAVQWMDNLDYNNPTKMRASLQEAASLLGGRIAAAGNRYNDAMAPMYQRDPLSWMSQKGLASYNRALSIDPIKGEGPMPQGGTQQPAGKPPVVFQNGHRYELQSDGSYK